MTTSTQLSPFLNLVADTLTRDAVHPVAQEGARQLTAALAEPLTMLPHQPSTIDALGSLDALGSHELTDAVRGIAPSLPWEPSHRVDDGGAHTGLALLDDVVDLGPVVAGLTVLDANSAYPRHNHPPSEVYLILGGQAEWRSGGSEELVTRRTGDIVHNNPNDWHEMRTGDIPTIAIWFLWTA